MVGAGVAQRPHFLSSTLIYVLLLTYRSRVAAQKDSQSSEQLAKPDYTVYHRL